MPTELGVLEVTIDGLADGLKKCRLGAEQRKFHHRCGHIMFPLSRKVYLFSILERGWGPWRTTWEIRTCSRNRQG